MISSLACGFAYDIQLIPPILLPKRTPITKSMLNVLFPVVLKFAPMREIFLRFKNINKLV